MKRLMSMMLALFLFVCLLFAGCNSSSLPVSEEVAALAERGDAVAQLKIGLAFDKEQNFEKAVCWYKKAAEQGLSEAQNNLGVMYKDGQGVKQDYQEAARWFMLAAGQDSKLAQLNLGWLYHAGKGVSQNADSARYWYLLSATKGHAPAQLNMGILCLQQCDTAVGIYWLKKAAEQGSERAQRVLKIIGVE